MTDKPLPKQPESAEGASADSLRKSVSSADDSDEVSDEKAAMAGLLRTIQKPLSTLGRIFSDDDTGPATTPRLSPAPRHVADATSQQQQVHSPSRTLSAEVAAARQASAETAEAQRIQQAEHANVVDTLAGMFPDLDREIISDVVNQKEGR